MTFTRDNIVGVEFTVKGGKTVYKITGLMSDNAPIVEWELNGHKKSMHAYTLKNATDFLHTGEWIVKNSKV